MMRKFKRGFIKGAMLGILFLPVEFMLLSGVSGRSVVWAQDNLDLRSGSGSHQELRENIRDNGDTGSDVREAREEDTIRVDRNCETGGRTCMPENRPTRDPDKDPRNYRLQPSSQPTESLEPTQGPTEESTQEPTQPVPTPTILMELTPAYGVGGEDWQPTPTVVDESGSDGNESGDNGGDDDGSDDDGDSEGIAVGGPQVLGLSDTSSGYGIIEAVLSISGLLCIVLSKKLLGFGKVG